MAKSNKKAKPTPTLANTAEQVSTPPADTENITATPSVDEECAGTCSYCQSSADEETEKQSSYTYLDKPELIYAGMRPLLMGAIPECCFTMVRIEGGEKHPVHMPKEVRDASHVKFKDVPFGSFFFKFKSGNMCQRVGKTSYFQYTETGITKECMKRNTIVVLTSATISAQAHTSEEELREKVDRELGYV